MRFTHSIKLTVAAMVVGAFAVGCSGGSSEQAASQPSSKPKQKKTQVAASPKGIGPIQHMELKPIDAATVATGKEIFDSKCATCHKFEERYVGPPMAGITKRREPEWIMNMMLNPDQMIKEDPEAKALFTEYLTPMTFQNLSEADAEAVLMYFRSVDGS